MNTVLRTLLALVMFALLPSAMADRELKEKDFSGWLDEYDSLVFVEDRNAFLFFNEERRGQYSKVILEDIAVFSSNGDSDPKIAKNATDYLTEGLQALVDEKGVAATEPGEGVARLKIAITGVEKSKEDLKPRNFVPVAAVFRGAQAATGNVATYIDTMFEAEMVDSVSGERVAAIVTKGIEETEKRSGDKLTFDDVKPTLDRWLAQYSQTLDEYFK